MIRTFGLAGCFAGSAAKSTTGMSNISEARALIAGSVSRTRKSGKKGKFTVIGKISTQDCGWEEFFVHLLGKMAMERPPIRSAKRPKCDDFSIDFSLRLERVLVTPRKAPHGLGIYATTPIG
jgi:hypothetical protein